MKIFNRNKGLKGSRFAYNHQVRTGIEEKDRATVENRLAVLDHAKVFGIRSAINAFKVSERTIKYWRHKLREKQGNPKSLAKESTRPKHFRKHEYSDQAYEYVKNFKKDNPKIGKEKIAYFLKKDLGEKVVPSTVHRIIVDLRKRGLLPEKVKYSFNGKTGVLHVKKQRKTKVKLRRGDYKPKGRGDIVQVDTIELRIKDRKFFLTTGVDIFNRIAYARIAKHHNSKEAKEFLMILPQYLGYKMNHVQTDNGKEFCKYFEVACEELHIDHFWNHPRSPKENTFVERFNRTIQDEWLPKNYHLFWFGSLEEIQKSLEEYLLWYNTKRPHWSLDFLTPYEYDRKQLES
jgi:putative transposase